MPKRVSGRGRGTDGEAKAARFLEGQGMKILARNYRFERGEIDLICEDGDELVFVEVKTRSSSVFGDPEEAVSESKQAQIRAVADGYCYEHEIDDRFSRFDVVTVELRNGKEIIRHLRNAF